MGVCFVFNSDAVGLKGYHRPTSHFGGAPNSAPTPLSPWPVAPLRARPWESGRGEGDWSKHPAREDKSNRQVSMQHIDPAFVHLVKS